MENHVFEGNEAAKAVIHIQGDFSPAVFKELAELEAVINVSVLRETQ